MNGAFSQLIAYNQRMVLMQTITSAWLARIPRLSELALVLCAAWLLAAWLLPEGEGGSREYQAGQLQMKAPLDQKLLLSTGLFGVEAQKPQPTIQNKAPQKLPPSRLAIKLMGTIVSADKPAAILSVGSKVEQKVFFVGQTIQPGVKLHAVEERAVVVDASGRMSRVNLLEDGNAGADNSFSGAGSSMGSGNRIAIHTSSGPVRQVSRSMVNQQTQDLSRLLTQARVTPHFVNGKSEGFVISSITPGSLYEKIGVQNGDVIRKVNGAVISGPAQAMAMFEGLKTKSSVSLQIQRAGRIQDLQYDIQ